MIVFKEPRVNAVWPAVIAAGAGLLGGIMSSRSSSKTNKSNIYQSQQADNAALIRQKDAQAFSRSEATKAWLRQTGSEVKDRAMQKEFAQHGIGWKAADARAAGIDPLAAMGSTTLYSPVGKPVQSGNAGIASPGSPARNYPTDYSFIGQMGQSISRSMQKTLTNEQLKHELAMKALTRENLGLDNDYKLMRNMQFNKETLNYGSQVAAPFPSDHGQQIQGQSDSVNVVPDKVVRHQGGHKAGVHAMHQYREGEEQPDGTIPIYSAIEQEAGDAMDADLPTKGRYIFREGKKMILSWFKGKKSVKPKIYKKGYRKRWNRAFGQWEFVPIGTPVKQRRIIDVPGDRIKNRNPTFKRYKIN